MRSIPAESHRILDIATVIVFVVAPLALGMSGLAAALSYLLAMVHLAMTLTTRFSDEQSRSVPFRLHGAIECAVGTGLIALPWVLRWHDATRAFYLSAGAVILLVWALSAYRVPASRASA